MIPTEGKQCGPFYYGITPEEIRRIAEIALEAYRRGKKGR